MYAIRSYYEQLEAEKAVETQPQQTVEPVAPVEAPVQAETDATEQPETVTEQPTPVKADRDKDGVADSRDLCANSKTGAAVNVV